MSSHLCGGGGRGMTNSSGGDPLAEVLKVECAMGLEVMLDRNKTGQCGEWFGRSWACSLGVRGGTGRCCLPVLSLLSRQGGLGQWSSVLLSAPSPIWRLQCSFPNPGHILSAFSYSISISLPALSPAGLAFGMEHTCSDTEHTCNGCRRRAWEQLFRAAEAQSAPHLCPVGENAPYVTYIWPRRTWLYFCRTHPHSPFAFPFLLYPCWQCLLSLVTQLLVALCSSTAAQHGLLSGLAQA